jgi:hypothetical protein
MQLLQVSDFPDDIYEEISFEAQRENRTIAQETIALIKKGLDDETIRKARRRRITERIQAMPKVDLGGIDSATVIREMREERTQAIINAIEGRS